MYTIYCLTNNKTGELFYIGCTKQKYACKRKGNHIERARANDRKNKCVEYIRNCDFDISLSILEKFEGNPEKAFEREQFWLDLHNPVGNTTGARPIPPMMGGHNRIELSQDIIEKLGTMPDYKLAKVAGVCKPCIQRNRIKRNIPSFAEKTGNNGKFYKGNPHPRWTKKMK